MEVGVGENLLCANALKKQSRKKENIEMNEC